MQFIMASNQNKQQGSFKQLNIILLAVIVLMGFYGCKQTVADGETETLVRSDVSITHPIGKDVAIYNDYQGVTQFTQHLQIRAQATGIVLKNFVLTGAKINAKQSLFVIISREAALIHSSTKIGGEYQMADTVFSFSSGVIDQVLVQQGDFVQEGDLLATVVSETSMRIVVSIPLEENNSNIRNTDCDIVLPNGNVISGLIGAPLPIANSSEQTSQYLVKPESALGLTENMHVKVRVKSRNILNGVFVPRTSVYSNEELTRFWLLKVNADSMALKVSVVVGEVSDSLIEIIEPTLNLSDNIILKGGYGLRDSALVNIIYSNGYEKK